MSRSLLLATTALLATTGAALLTAGGAEGRSTPTAVAAALTELGVVAGQQLPAPSCPGTPCNAVTRTTGFMARAGTVSRPLTANRTGKIVAFTLRLSKPTDKQIAFFDKTYGKPAQARIAILKPAPTVATDEERRRGTRRYQRKRDPNRFLVNAQSETIDLTKHFGQTAQFPLARSLTVRRGWIVALTVPTWAPGLVVNLGQETAWRAARASDECEDVAKRTDRAPRAVASFPCLYRGAQLSYSATLISTP